MENTSAILWADCSAVRPLPISTSGFSSCHTLPITFEPSRHQTCIDEGAHASHCWISPIHLPAHAHRFCTFASALACFRSNPLRALNQLQGLQDRVKSRPAGRAVCPAAFHCEPEISRTVLGYATEVRSSALADGYGNRNWLET